MSQLDLNRAVDDDPVSRSGPPSVSTIRLREMARKHGIDEDETSHMLLSSYRKRQSGTVAGEIYLAENRYESVWNTSIRALWEIGVFLIVFIFIIIILPIRIAAYSDQYNTNHIIYSWLICDICIDIILFIDLYMRMRIFWDLSSEEDNDNDNNDNDSADEHYVAIKAVQAQEKEQIWGDGQWNMTYCLGTEFKLDIISVIPIDYIICILLFSQPDLIPFLRIHKYLRIRHLRHGIERLQDFIESKGYILSASVWRLFMVFLITIIVIHCWACIWLCIGHLGIKCNEDNYCYNTNNWLGYNDECDPMTCSFSRRYLRSLYSATSTVMTVGLGDIRPQNVLETSINLIFLIVGLLICSSITATFVVIFTNAANERSAYQTYTASVTKYLIAKKLPHCVVERTNEYFAYLWKSQKGLSEDILLNKLPPHLKQDSIFYMLCDSMKNVSFLSNEDDGVLFSLVTYMIPVVYPRNTYVYVKTQKAKRIYFLYHGQCGIPIIRNNDHNDNQQNNQPQNKNKTVIYQTGSSFCAKALFVNYTHSHSLQALTLCEIFQLEKEKFVRVLKGSYGNKYNNKITNMFNIMKENETLDVMRNILESKHIRKSFIQTHNYDEKLDDNNDNDNDNDDDDNDVLLDSIFHPDHSFRYKWNTSIFLITFFLALTLPLRLSIREGVNSVHYIWITSDVIIDILLWIDLYLRSRCFYIRTDHSLDIIISEPKQIFLLFKKTYFYPDFLSCLPIDYMVLFILYVVYNNNISLSLNYFLYFRLLRLIRLLHFNQIRNSLYHIAEDIRFIWVDVHIVNLLILFTVNLVVFHWGACLWYFIGRHGIENNLYTWLDNDDVNVNNYFHAYIRSLYFVIVGFTTTGYGDIRAYTNYETIFVIFWLLLGVNMYYGSIAAISIGITNATAVDNNFQSKLEEIHCFSKHNKLSSRLTTRIRGYYRHMWKRFHGLEKEILKQLPNTVYADVVGKLNENILSQSSLFLNCSWGFIHTVASKLNLTLFVPNDYIVHYNDLATQMFIFNSGTAHIIYNHHQNNDQNHKHNNMWSSEKAKRINSTFNSRKFTQKFILKYDDDNNDNNNDDNNIILGSLGGDTSINIYGSSEMMQKGRYTSSVKSITFCDVSILDYETLFHILDDFPEQKEQLRMNTLNIIIKTEQLNNNINNNLDNNKIKKMFQLGIKNDIKKVPLLRTNLYLFGWSCIIFIMYFYQMISIPLRFSFIYLATYKWFIIDFIMDILFIIDSYLNAYKISLVNNDGSLIINRDNIFKLYKKNRMKLDIITSIPIDIIPLILIIYYNDYNNNTYLELWAYIRIQKLFRIVRLPTILTEIRTAIQERDINLNPNIISIIALFMYTFTIAHWLGCGLFLISRYEGALNNTTQLLWLHEFQEYQSMYYLRSLYWAMSTITVVCLGDVTVTTIPETIYNIFVMCATFFLIATLIGNIASLYARLNASEKNMEEKLESYAEYMKRHKLNDMMPRVYEYFTHKYVGSNGVNEEIILSELPRALRNDLSYERYGGLLLYLPLFTLLEVNVIRQLCGVLKSSYFGENNILYRQGDVGSSMFILVYGQVSVLKINKQRENDIYRKRILRNQKIQRRLNNNPRKRWHKLRAMVLPHHTNLYLESVRKEGRHAIARTTRRIIESGLELDEEYKQDDNNDLNSTINLLHPAVMQSYDVDSYSRITPSLTPNNNSPINNNKSLPLQSFAVSNNNNNFLTTPTKINFPRSKTNIFDNDDDINPDIPDMPRALSTGNNKNQQNNRNNNLQSFPGLVIDRFSKDTVRAVVQKDAVIMRKKMQEELKRNLQKNIVRPRQFKNKTLHSERLRKAGLTPHKKVVFSSDTNNNQNNNNKNNSNKNNNNQNHNKSSNIRNKRKSRLRTSLSRGGNNQPVIQEVARLSEGNILGATSLLLKTRRLSSVQACTFSECLTLESDAFFNIMKSYPHYLERMIYDARNRVKNRNNEPLGVFGSKFASPPPPAKYKKSPSQNNSTSQLFNEKQKKSRAPLPKRSPSNNNDNNDLVPNLDTFLIDNQQQNNNNDQNNDNHTSIVPISSSNYNDIKHSKGILIDSHLNTIENEIEMKILNNENDNTTTTNNNNNENRPPLSRSHSRGNSFYFKRRRKSYNNINNNINNNDNNDITTRLKDMFKETATIFAEKRGLIVTPDKLGGNLSGMFYPTDYFYQLWNIIIVILTIYNTLVIPFRLAFMQVSPVIDLCFNWLIIDYVLDILYIIDIYLRCFRLLKFSKYAPLGQEKIFKLSAYGDYSNIYFWFHIFASIPWDILCLLGYRHDISLTIIQLQIYLRLTKIARLVTISPLVDSLKPVFQGYKINSTIIGFISTASVLSIVSHWMACLFIFIGYHADSIKNSNDIYRNWREADDLLEYNIVGIQYLRAIYYIWMAMTTVGYGDVSPRPTNIIETLFGCFLIIVATNCFASTVAAFEAYFKNEDQDLANFQLFVKYNKVYMHHRQFPDYLQHRINLYYSFTWMRSKGIDETRMLDQLPYQMKIDIAMRVNRDIIERVPIFQEVDKGLIKALASVLKPLICVASDTIVSAGTLGEEMYFIKDGVVSKMVDERMFTLERGEFFGEDQLVSDKPWEGTFIATTVCDLFTLCCEDYLRCLRYFPRYEKVLIWKMRQISQERMEFQAQLQKSRGRHNSVHIIEQEKKEDIQLKKLREEQKKIIESMNNSSLFDSTYSLYNDEEMVDLPDIDDDPPSYIVNDIKNNHNTSKMTRLHSEFYAKHEHLIPPELLKQNNFNQYNNNNQNNNHIRSKSLNVGSARRDSLMLHLNTTDAQRLTKSFSLVHNNAYTFLGNLDNYVDSE